MKRIISIILFIITSSSAIFSQNFKTVLENSPKNYLSIDSAAFANRNMVKDLSERDAKEFNRWNWYWRTRIDNTGSFDKIAEALLNYIKKNKKNSQTSMKKSAPGLTWDTLGPNTYPSGSGNTRGTGRISSLWVDPSDVDYILAGSNNAGLWKTTNGGVSWSNITDTYLTGGITDIAVNPANNDIIYLSTHVRPANGSLLMYEGQYSLGIFKTTDGGINWTSLNTGPIPITKTPMRRILINPNLTTSLFVLMGSGVYKSTNAGTTWVSAGLSITESPVYSFEEMLFKPGDPNTIYVSGKNTLFKTTDGGANWDELYLDDVFDNARISIAVEQDSANNLYAFYCDMDTDSDTQLEKSENGGSTWDLQYSSNLTGKTYVNHIWIAPDGDIFAGGVSLSRSAEVDDGTNFHNLSFTSIHSDVRDCIFPDPNGDDIYLATDGGIYIDSNDGASWQRITGNISANEFYAIGITEEDSELLIGGTHDCGSYLRDATGVWTYEKGGDGATSFFDHEDSDIYYYSSNKNFYRNDATGENWLYKFDAYDSPVFMHPTDSDILYRSLEVQTPSLHYTIDSSMSKGESWSTLSTVTNTVFDMTICDSDPNSIYFTTWNSWTDAKIYYSSNGGSTCSQVGYTGISDIIDAAIATNIVVNPFDPSDVWVTFGGFESDKKVYFSDDYGQNWVNESGTDELPNIPIQCFVFDFLNGFYYVGTDVGVYYKSIDEGTWERAGAFPCVMVTDMHINKAYGDLVVSTYGRGIYRTNLGEGFCNNSGSLVIISSSTSWTTDQEVCSDIEIRAGGTLTIYSDVIMSYLGKITVKSGGILVVDGGTIINANIKVESGGGLKLYNDGMVELNYGDELDAASGATINITSGELNSSTMEILN